MARFATPVQTNTPHALFGRCSSRRSLHPLRRSICRRSSQKEEVAYGDPITAFVDKVLKREQTQSPVDGLGEEKLKNLPIESLRDFVVEGVTKNQWFVTGRVDARVFSDDFRFVDPSVNVQGVKQYADGVARLFDGDRSRVDIVSATVNGPNSFEVVWRLEATMSFPLSPKIKPYLVTTVYETDDEGLITLQQETFSIPDWEVVVSMFAPWIGSPPEPPVTSPPKL